MGESIKTMEEFIAWTEEREDKLFVYRGMANATWGVKSSAYRRIRQSQEVPPPLSVLQSYIKQLLQDARALKLQEREGGRSLTDFQLLSELQHYGAATCLIDFTRNASVALWFACRDEPQKPGRVVAMGSDYLFGVSSLSPEDPVGLLNQDKLWKWNAVYPSTRAITQRSVFVFGPSKIDEKYFESIEIDGGSKGKIREELAKKLAIIEPYLFGDLPGFATSHAHDRPYSDYTADDCFSLGSTAQQQEFYGEAKEFYGRALELDPQYPGARKNLETVKQLLAQVKAKQEAEREAEREDVKQLPALVEALATGVQQIASSEELKALATGVQRITSSEGFKVLATGVQRMNDPHVVALVYNVKHSASVDYSEAKPFEHEVENFKITIENDKACFTMKAHYATEEEARKAVEEYIQVWELDAALQAGPNAFTLEFDGSHIEDRQPQPGMAQIHGVVPAPSATLTATAMPIKNPYPSPPSGMKISSDVQSMSVHFSRYCLKREILTTMANFCLTVLQGSAKNRKNAAKMYKIELAVLSKIGCLCNNKGGEEARKKAGSDDPLTLKEIHFLTEAAKAMIRQVAAYAYDPDPKNMPPTIKLTDLPQC